MCLMPTSIPIYHEEASYLKLANAKRRQGIATPFPSPLLAFHGPTHEPKLHPHYGKAGRVSELDFGQSSYHSERLFQNGLQTSRVQSPSPERGNRIGSQHIPSPMNWAAMMTMINLQSPTSKVTTRSRCTASSYLPFTGLEP